MISGRCSHALVRFLDNIYIFGGNNAERKAEVYSLKKDSWSELPDLPVSIISSFGTFHKNLIYIAS